MNIRPAKPEELNRILEIYGIARQFQCETGNPDQWNKDNYPPPSLVEEDIRTGVCHVCEENGRIVGVFALCPGEDPTYRHIEGAWPNSEPYAAVHRIASDGSCHGVAAFCFDWCLKRHENIRIDTHADNKVMQHVLEKNGFVPCGTIYLENGEPRLAYQKTKPQEAPVAEPRFTAKAIHDKACCREFGHLQLKRTKASLVILICSLVLFLLQLGLSFTAGITESVFILILGSFFFIYWLFWGDIVGQNAYKGFTNTKLHTETTYAFFDTHFSFSSSLEASNLSYRAIDTVAESDNLFALYLNKNAAHLLPKSGFTQGTPEDFRLFLAGKTQKPVARYRVTRRPALKWVLAVAVPLLMVAASFGAAKLGDVLGDGIVLPYIHGDYTITLPVAFEEMPEYAEESGGYNYYYTEDVSIYVLRETADELMQELGYVPTLEEYALLYWGEDTEYDIHPDGSLIIAEVYEDYYGDSWYSYDVFCLKDGVFWSTEFSCDPEMQATYEEQFASWAATIRIE